jgi:hypothetical protein
VAEETEAWLEQLEVSWSLGERVERGPGGRGAEKEGANKKENAKDAGDDVESVEAYLACVDKLAAAERFFSERRAYKARVQGVCFVLVDLRSAPLHSTPLHSTLPLSDDSRGVSYFISSDGRGCRRQFWFFLRFKACFKPLRINPPCFEGAESSWKHAGELLDKSLVGLYKVNAVDP